MTSIKIAFRPCRLAIPCLPWLAGKFKVEDTMQAGTRWLLAATGIAAVLALAAPARAETTPHITAVTVTGDAVVGATLTAEVVVMGDPSLTVAYSWRRCSATKPSHCSAIAGGTASTYVVSDADVGRVLRVSVTATNVAGSEKRRSAP